jgi:hypothetical protein
LSGVGECDVCVCGGVSKDSGNEVKAAQWQQKLILLWQPRLKPFLGG